MSLYQGPLELLKAAVNKGIINIGGINIRIGGVNVTTPGAINILKPNEWKTFLQDVINATDDKQEKDFANTFLQSMKQIETSMNNQIKNRGQIISKQIIDSFSDALNKCESFDDVFRLIEANVKSLHTTPHQSVSKVIQPNIQTITDKRKLLDELTWKKPYKFNNTYRYYANEVDWFIQRQESVGPKGGISYYYSIFTHQKREIARYDRLKDAKNDMIKLIKQTLEN